MSRTTKAPADDAIVRFYGTLVEMNLDDDDVPGLQIMFPFADVRAIIRDRNNLQDHKNESQGQL